MKNSQMISTMSARRKKSIGSLQEAKRKALRSLYYFDKYVLGYNLMVPHVHGEMCEFAAMDIERGDGEQSKKLILEPRGVFKSRCITIGYVMWRLARNPNLTIIIANEKREKAKEFLKEIKLHITYNKRFRLLFGDWRPDTKRHKNKVWSVSAIDIAPKTSYSGTPNIEISSTESSPTGKHGDLVIADDLMGRSNTTTSDQMDKVISYYGELMGSVLNPGGEGIIIGTRWDERDVYQHIMDTKATLDSIKPGLSRTEVLTKKAIQDDDSLLFPERLTRQFLESYKVDNTIYDFNCQYQNTPVNKENALINRIDEYTDTIGGMPADEYFAQCIHIVTMDLAFTENKKSDSTVINVRAINPKTGMRHVRLCHAFKTSDPKIIVDKMFRVEQHYRPMRWGIEKNNWQAWLQKIVEEEMRRRGVFMNIDPPGGLSHYGKSQNKAMRLRKLAPVYNNGMCAIHKSMTKLKEQLQLLTYDGVKGHDDLIDADAMQEEIFVWGAQGTANTYDNDVIQEREKFKKFREENYVPVGRGIEMQSDFPAWLTA